ncbi:TPA: hypothetical protein RQK91_002783 [Vibrio vulnificus]|nr:hypothetical protein [Vibrio vulnificus]
MNEMKFARLLKYGLSSKFTYELLVHFYERYLAHTGVSTIKVIVPRVGQSVIAWKPMTQEGWQFIPISSQLLVSDSEERYWACESEDFKQSVVEKYKCKAPIGVQRSERFIFEINRSKT